MEKIRLFIAIEIHASKKIKDLINEVEKTGINAKLVEPENLHLTLKFLGDTDKELTGKIEETIKKSVADIKPFEIILKNIGVFPNQDYIKVVWIGVENIEILKDIAEKIDTKLQKIGFKKEKRPFSAHLTIARVKSAKNKEKLIQLINKYQNIELQKIKIDKITIKQSTLTPKGPIYTNLKEIMLKE
jgi:RNA 2',3'-cyclic 3'-phosphodiesterase